MRAPILVVVSCVLAGMVAYSIPATPPSSAEFGRSETGGLRNGGFEEIASVPSLPGIPGIPGWTLSFGRGGFAVTGEIAHGGKRSLHVDDRLTDESAGLRSAPLAVMGGRAYAVSGKVRSIKGSLGIHVTYGDSRGKKLSEQVRYYSGGSRSWREISFATKAPAKAESATVMLYSSVTATTEAYVDSLEWQESWLEERIGPMNRNIAVSAATTGKWTDGRTVVYLPLIGTPNHLVVLDIAANKVLRDLELPESKVCWTSTTTRDGTVYIGCQFGGRLYRYRPGNDRVEELGTVVPGGDVLWGLTTDPGGRIYGGAFSRDWPDGRVYSLDPGVPGPGGGRVRDYGPVTTTKPHSQYARDIAVRDGRMYVGLGTTGARIFELDIRSGAKREISMPRLGAHDDEVFDVDVHGDVLFARLAPSQRLLAYDLKQNRWQDLGKTHQSPVSPPRAGKIYYVDAADRLREYELASRRTRTVGTSQISAAKIIGWHENKLLMVDFFGRIRSYDVHTHADRVTIPPVYGRPGPIHSMAEGPDGRIYTSAYPSGGLAFYDPLTRKKGQYQQGVVPQIEGMLAFGDRLYLGKYPGAFVMSFDPAKPFAGGANPRFDASLKPQGQDRPFAWTAVGDVIALGTVPDYGKLGGALALYDPRTKKLEAFPNIVRDHSVVALASVDVGGRQVVFGGTSVWGGMGKTPERQEARLFAFDPRTRRKLWETVPLPGERAITALAIAPDGHVWGITVGKLFEFDPATRKVLRIADLEDFAWSDHKQVWRSGQLSFGRDGRLIALVLGQVRLLDTDGEELKARTIASDVEHMVVAREGAIYLSRGVDLFRLAR